MSTRHTTRDPPSSPLTRAHFNSTPFPTRRFHACSLRIERHYSPHAIHDLGTQAEASTYHYRYHQRIRRRPSRSSFSDQSETRFGCQHVQSTRAPEINITTTLPFARSVDRRISCTQYERHDIYAHAPSSIQFDSGYKLHVKSLLDSSTNTSVVLDSYHCCIISHYHHIIVDRLI